MISPKSKQVRIEPCGSNYHVMCRGDGERKGGPREAQIAATLHAQTTVPLAWIAPKGGAPMSTKAAKRCVKP